MGFKIHGTTSLACLVVANRCLNKKQKIHGTSSPVGFLFTSKETSGRSRGTAGGRKRSGMATSGAKGRRCLVTRRRGREGVGGRLGGRGEEAAAMGEGVAAAEEEGLLEEVEVVGRGSGEVGHEAVEEVGVLRADGGNGGELRIEHQLRRRGGGFFKEFLLVDGWEVEETWVMVVQMVWGWRIDDVVGDGEGGGG